MLSRKMLLLLLCALVGLAGCGSNNQSPIQEAIGATDQQSIEIEGWLSSADVVCQSITASHSQLVKSLDENWIAYDLIGEDGNDYVLILRKEDFDFTAVFTQDGLLLAGLIDNSVLPDFFDEQIWTDLGGFYHQNNRP